MFTDPSMIEQELGSKYMRLHCSMQQAMMSRIHAILSFDSQHRRFKVGGKCVACQNWSCSDLAALMTL